MAKIESSDKKKEEKRLAKPGLKVELIKGDQWTDDLSGISLFRGFYNMASKGDMKGQNGIRDNGYTKLEDEKKPVDTLPENKDLTRVEQALKLGILKVYDPKNPTEYLELRDMDRRTRVYDPESPDGHRYRNEEDEKIKDFLSLDIDKFRIQVVKIKSSKTLEKLYEAEHEGRNSGARPRKVYVDLLKKQIKNKAEGVGNIKVEETKEVVKLT